MPTLTPTRPKNVEVTLQAPQRVSSSTTTARLSAGKTRLEHHLGAFVATGLTIVLIRSLLALELVGGWPGRTDGDEGWNRWDGWILAGMLLWALILAGHALVAMQRRNGSQTPGR